MSHNMPAAQVRHWSLNTTVLPACACVASWWWTLQPVVLRQQEATNRKPHTAATSMLRPSHNNALAAVHRTISSLCMRHDSCNFMLLQPCHNASECHVWLQLPGGGGCITVNHSEAPLSAKQLHTQAPGSCTHQTFFLATVANW
jgi:hypothetical protein